MIRFSWGFAGCVLVLALVATTGLAQEKGQRGRGRGGLGFGGGGSLVFLASNEAVQKEIGADEATVGKIRKIGEDSRQAMQDIFAGGGNPQDRSEEERQKAREKFEELSKKSSAELKEALSADQYKRLQQISWQAAGAAALDDETVAKELSIGDDQKEKIAAVREDYSQKRRALGRDATPEQRRELAQEETKKVTDLLSPEQQEKFTALKGKTFDVSQLRTGFGGGRPGGGKGGKNRPKTE